MGKGAEKYKLSGTSIRLEEGSVVIRNLKTNCTVYGLAWREIYPNETHNKPLNHTVFTDAQGKTMKSRSKRNVYQKTKLWKIKSEEKNKSKQECQLLNKRNKTIVNVSGDKK